ncbi:MAG: hypothetical protein A3B68_04385 [Candidatus Melainabacteria bacterium RIFCSPHIGHO2_02_FULL_34_12]|nr:MAG: hypothetical protein A3B68_04385 [Candidatus Melainabacteria bacterium RIFCSPHIGHO2_02_FULL_34_12]
MKLNQIKNLTGLFFIFLGISLNECILSNFFSYFAVAKLYSKLPVPALEIFFIILGVLLLVIKIDKDFIQKARNFYKSFALVLLNIISLFVFVCMLVSLISFSKDFLSYKEQIFKQKNILHEIYPDLNNSQIKKVLHETWSRGFSYEPYTQFKESPYKGQFLNVSEHGFRHIKNQGPWPPLNSNFNIFIFGGSATFNYGLPDNQTIASCLQELLRKNKNKENICVYNFARGFYYSTQERILFQKLLSENQAPDLAVFIDGFNEFYFIKDEPLYTEELKYFLGGNLDKLLQGIFTTNKVQPKYDDPDILNQITSRYLINKKLIEATADAFSVKTLFVWQPVPTYKYNLKYYKFANGDFGRFTYSRYGYEVMDKIKNKLGANFFWLADIQKDINKPVYIDVDHYSSEMSRLIAKKINDYLISKNLVN